MYESDRQGLGPANPARRAGFWRGHPRICGGAPGRKWSRANAGGGLARPNNGVSLGQPENLGFVLHPSKAVGRGRTVSKVLLLRIRPTRLEKSISAWCSRRPISKRPDLRLRSKRRRRLPGVEGWGPKPRLEKRRIEITRWRICAGTRSTGWAVLQIVSVREGRGVYLLHPKRAQADRHAVFR